MSWTEKTSHGADNAMEEGWPPFVRAAGPTLEDSTRDLILRTVSEHGAALVRGLDVSAPDDFVTGARAIVGTPLEDREGFAPRTPLPGGAYSATHWAAEQEMCVHHESSHALRHPRLLAFGCAVPATEGGATVLADGSRVLQNLPAALVERFERVGWILERHYTEGVGLPWEQTFGTRSRAEVEEYCRANSIECIWDGDSALRTRQRRPAVVRHLGTGLRTWFNTVAFFNRWTLAADIREYLLSVYGEDGLPFDTRWGDGESLTEDVVEAVHKAYRSVSIRHEWSAGDLLIIDNLRVGHGREPHTGRRDVHVMMAGPTELGDRVPGPELAGQLELPPRRR